MGTAYSSQGQTIEIALETAPGVPGSYANMRVNEEPVGPKLEKDLAENPVVKYHPGDVEKPIPHEKFKEGALAIVADLRGGSDAATEPPAVSILASTGCDVNVEAADTTVATYTDEGSWTLTDDYADAGQAGIIELNSGVYWPTLVATDVAGAVTPTFELPSASQAGADWAKIHTVSPRYRQTPVDQTLAFRHTYRAAQTTNETRHVYTHCALSDGANIEVANAQGVTMNFSLTVSDTDTEDAAIAVETFKDAASKIFVGGPNFECAFADASSSTISNTAANRLCIESVTVNLGIKAAPIQAIGCDDINGCAGFMMAYEYAMVDLTVLFDKEYYSDIDDELLTSKYFHMIQGNTTGNSVFGLWVPNMHPAPGEDTVVTDSGNGYWKVTAKYQADISAYGGDTALDSQGAQPWYLALGVAP